MEQFFITSILVLLVSLAAIYAMPKFAKIPLIRETYSGKTLEIASGIVLASSVIAIASALVWLVYLIIWQLTSF